MFLQFFISDIRIKFFRFWKIRIWASLEHVGFWISWLVYWPLNFGGICDLGTHQIIHSSRWLQENWFDIIWNRAVCLDNPLLINSLLILHIDRLLRFFKTLFIDQIMDLIEYLLILLKFSLRKHRLFFNNFVWYIVKPLFLQWFLLVININFGCSLLLIPHKIFLNLNFWRFVDRLLFIFLGLNQNSS